MMPPGSSPRALRAVIVGISTFIVLILGLGIGLAEGKQHYELIRDLLVPLVGPLVAMLIPLMLFFVIPSGQNRDKLALELCAQYYAEEMRSSRNTGWAYFVTEQKDLPPIRRAERLRHFLDYLTNPETHRSIDPRQDEIYQKTSRILDFFALVNECVGRGTADAGIVRSFLLYYYLWWRDEIMDPLRKTGHITTDNPKFKPLWWNSLTKLDALAGNHAPRVVPEPERPTAGGMNTPLSL